MENIKSFTTYLEDFKIYESSGSQDSFIKKISSTFNKNNEDPFKKKLYEWVDLQMELYLAVSKEIIKRNPGETKIIEGKIKSWLVQNVGEGIKKLGTETPMKNSDLVQEFYQSSSYLSSKGKFGMGFLKGIFAL